MIGNIHKIATCTYVNLLESFDAVFENSIFFKFHSITSSHVNKPIDTVISVCTCQKTCTGKGFKKRDHKTSFFCLIKNESYSNSLIFED